MSEEQINQEQNGLEKGTYEIIRGRLDKVNQDLKQRIHTLNEDRKGIFGAIETQLVATEHISTEHSCEARDMVPIGDRFIFGYNVHLGLKTEVNVSDVFSFYEYNNRQLKEANVDLFNDETFISDFKNLYKYYRDSRFAQFVKKNNFLYLIFQIGKSTEDIKTFKWGIKPNGTLQYVDSRSEHEVKLPKQYGFDWKKPSNDFYRDGRHPHISIEDLVYVETVNGDLTIKIEDNTETGQGIYSEPVDHRDQSLNDADVSFAIIGQIVVLRIRPYQEKTDRYLIYNHKVKSVHRVDALHQSCVLLPEDQGIIFPQGFHLQSGETKLFDYPYEGMEFEQLIAAPNGEDFLYVFYNKATGNYTLLIYNLIEQSLLQPIHCSGYSIFENGEICLFRDDAEAKKHHSIQIWQSPFSHADQVSATKKDAYLYKVGNKEIVNAMAECRTIIKLLDREDPYESLYIDLSKSVRTILDAYHWVNHQEAHNLAEPLKVIEETAHAAIAEFDKVLRLRKTANEKLEELRGLVEKGRQKSKSANYDTIDRYVDTLTNIRALRGNIISAKEMRYINVEELAAMEEQLIGLQSDYSTKCVEFLLTDKALVPYEQKVDEIESRLEGISKVVEADQLDKDIATVSQELELLIDIVNSLNIEDSTVTTKIIDNITEIFYRFNRIIADLKKKRKSIFGSEAESEFKSQLKLIQQGASNYINLSDTPEKCDEYLNRLTIQLEELEGKFSDFPEFSMPITEVREEIYNAFESHKLALIEVRNNKSVAIHSSSERILEGVKKRLENFSSENEINAFLASDMLIQKVRDNVQKLIELDDSVKADELNAQIKTIRENAIRQLRDRKELFTEGEDIIKLGTHAFSVNTKKLDVTVVKKNNVMNFHLTGTNFFQPIKDPIFTGFYEIWDQAMVSENNEVYRAEYLAYLIYSGLTSIEGITFDDQNFRLSDDVILSQEDKSTLIQKFIANRYDERYIKGVHDVDAARIVDALIQMKNEADLLVYPSIVRAAARFKWNTKFSAEERTQWNNRLKAYGLLQSAFKQKMNPQELLGELDVRLENKEESNYLFEELCQQDKFIISKVASDLLSKFQVWLKESKLDKKLAAGLEQLAQDPQHQLDLVEDWLALFNQQKNGKEAIEYIKEAAVSFLLNNTTEERVHQATTTFDIEGLQGEHPLIKDGVYGFNFADFMHRLNAFEEQDVPRFRDFLKVKHGLVENFKKEIKLGSFEPKIMSSFVRNRLINNVYLPLIGNNMAKQIGVAGAEKRTDLMGMLLLISPPGYGKTTLMEYLAQRLGLIFVKINGPALGHSVTSVDPMSAPNSAAREELKRLNLAFEMGDNVMIYIDDIQHCNPEFLQKFISLCDAQRKIEGVFQGEPKTYDFRGRKVMVVMAGNPYTESGERFQIPDMLANRSDIYNLGDVIGDKQEVFELSYVENCLTSNAILEKLSNKSLKDVYELIRSAKSEEADSLQLEGNHTAEEIEDYVNLLKRVMEVQKVVFKVNLEYIRSASMEDAYRVAPPFKLQGSYRDMNKIVEKLVPVMNDEELRTLIISHYENESQTLTTAAESSLLKFKELFGSISENETERWESIKETFMRNQKLSGLGDSKMAHVLEQMESISKSLNTISQGFEKNGE